MTNEQWLIVATLAAFAVPIGVGLWKEYRRRHERERRRMHEPPRIVRRRPF